MSTSEERWFVVSPNDKVRGAWSKRPKGHAYFLGKDDPPQYDAGYKHADAARTSTFQEYRVVNFDEAVAIHAMDCARMSMEGV